MNRSIHRTLRAPLILLACLALTLPAYAQPIRGVSSSSAPACRTGGGQHAQGVGRYRQHGAYRSQPQHRGFRGSGQRYDYLSMPQPGSLLPGRQGFDGAGSYTPRSYRSHQGYRSHYGYGIPPAYVVYVPSSGENIDDRSHYASQELYDEVYEEPARSQPIYVVVQPPPPTAQPQAPRAAAQPPATVAPPPPSKPRSREPGEVNLMIEPPDAMVHLDDRLLGAAEEVANLVLSPGVYVLEVTHEELRSQRLVFGVQPGMPAVVEIDLRIEGSGRRARLTTPDDLPLQLGTKR